MILSASICVRGIFSKLSSLAFVLQTGAALLAIDLPNALYGNSSVSFVVPSCPSMLNVCFTENQIPKVWRQPKIIALLKPAKTRRYRRATDLCHMYKLYDSLILNRIAPSVDQHLIKEQVGFKPGSHVAANS